MKIPLIKIRGNLIRVESIIELDGLSVGTEAINSPRAEKQKAARSVPNTMDRFKVTLAIKNQLMEKITKVIIVP
jgi:hypothetical protein